MPQRCEAFLSVNHLQFRDYSTSRSHPADVTQRGSLLPRVTLCGLKMLHSVGHAPFQSSKLQ